MKKSLKIVVVTSLILFLLRGPVFRLAITYKDAGSRPSIALSEEILDDKIYIKGKKENITLDQIIEVANEITSNQLSFTSGLASNDPNELIATHKANCVGYAAMFASILNHLIEQNRLEGELKVEHKIGKLELFGLDLHQYFESAFVQEHDFDIIADTRTGETSSRDPTIRD